MNKKLAKDFLFVVAVVVLVAVLFGTFMNKPDIHEAEISDIQAIEGFGEVLSERVVSYLDANPKADIEDLTVIDGIGPYRVKLLRKEFK